MNEEQLKAIRTEKNSVIVAGAGSGKTTVLASKIIYLLIKHSVDEYSENNTVFGIEHILCLTFTRKATTEMQERIYTLLSKCIEEKEFLDEALDEKKIDFLIRQKESFQNANIMTLDAFGLKIAQVGMSRKGEIKQIAVNDNVNDEIEIFVSKWLLKNKDSYLHNLLQHHTFSAIVSKVLSPILENSSCFHIALNEMYDRMFEKIYNDILQSCKHSLEHANELKNIIYKAEPHPQKSVLKFVLTLEHIIEDITNLIKTIYADTDPINIHNPIEDTLSLSGVTTTKSIKPYAGMVRDMKILIEAEIKNSNDGLYTYSDKDTYKKYYTAFQPLLDDWNAHRKIYSLYTYANISEIAQHTLEHDKEVQSWYSKYFQYIIIDEFQDNNIDQRDLLYRLSHIDKKDINANTMLHQKKIEQGKYFFVGDPKQSIYGFRGANIQAFLSLKDDNLTLSMNTNYRSNNALIHLFNDWFEKMFADEKINSDGIAYESQKSPNQEENPTIETSDIFKNILSADEYDKAHLMPQYPCLFDFIYKGEIKNCDKQDIEAYNIASRIKTMKNNGIALDDIAVLSRTKSIFTYIARYLLEENIPYHMENTASSLSQDVGMDFYAWLSFIFQPENKSSYAAVLHSPLAHISMNSRYALLHIHRPVNEDNAFRVPKKLDANIQAYINEEDQISLTSLRNKFEEARKILLEQADVLALLYHFWIECGYRYIILRKPKAHIFLEQFDVLKMLCLNKQKDGIGACITALKMILEGKGDGKNLQTTSPTKQKGVVQLMTIHKAKGLEFPYVILASMHDGFVNKQNEVKNGMVDDILYIDFPHSKKTPYLLKVEDGEEEKRETIHHKKLKIKKDTDERLRVLYVGSTRAKTALILSGFTFTAEENKSDTYFRQMVNLGIMTFPNENKNTIQTSKTHISIQKTVDYIEQSKEHKIHEAHNPIQHTIDYALTLPVRDYIANYESKVFEISPSRASHNTTQTKSTTKQETLPTLPVDAILNKHHTHDMHAVFGTYCHFLLRYYCKKQKAEVPPIQLESRLLPLSEEDMHIFKRDAERLCKEFISHKIWKTQNAECKIYVEYHFLLWNAKNEVWMRGIIDLLIIKNNQYIIIDYKVDKHKTPEQYTYQLASYRLAVQKIFGLEHQNTINPNAIKSYLFYLREGLLYEHRETTSEDTLIRMLKEG